MASKHLGIPVVPKASISSPVTQTTKPKSPPSSPPPPAFTLKDIQDALKKTAQDIKNEVAELFENKNREMREDIVLAFQGLAAHIERIDQRVDEVVENTAKLEYRLGKVEDKMDTTQDEVIMSQYRDMEFALRIRGLNKNPQEDFREEVARNIAPILGCEPEEILREIDRIFRVNSWIARQRNLPRDVVIYFSRRSLRNEIIQAFYKQRFQIAAQDVIILKEIPPKILRKRKDFAFLAEELKTRQIQFRWEIPVGIVVNYNGTRYRLNTILKAKDLYTSVLKAGSPPSPRSKRTEERPEEQAEAAMLLVAGDLQSGSMEQCLEVKGDSKEQRMTRAAHRRKEKEQQKADVGSIIHGSITTEPVGGTRPKRSSTADLQVVFLRLQAIRDGKVSDMEC